MEESKISSSSMMAFWIHVGHSAGIKSDASVWMSMEIAWLQMTSIGPAATTAAWPVVYWGLPF
eukprot:10894931-Lingulodinium_polyedra.AAC.1